MNILMFIVLYADILHEYTNKEEESESELESDGEDVGPPNIIPVKRKLPQSKKRLKIPKFVNPAKSITASSSTQKVFKPEDIFEPVQREEIKNLKIELKTLDKSLEASVNKQDNTTIDGGFGLISPVSKTTKDTKDSEENAEMKRNECITSEELEAKTARISINDQRLLPVFKNYHPGIPSNRLYIKNLAKQVEIKDLHYIYKRYFIAGLEDAEDE